MAQDEKCVLLLAGANPKNKEWILQAEHDPMGTYQDICEITKNLSNAKSVCIKGDDHDYKDMDELVRFCMVKYNHER